ncbi:MAG: hypothetical protein AAF639_47195 [Chloroflexota bacterium]
MMTKHENLPKLFLETTIQIERATAIRTRQREIADILQKHYVLTSTYVLGEYLRTLVSDAILLLDLVEANEQMYDVETQMAGLFSKRSLSRCVLLWGMLHRSGHHRRKGIITKLRNKLDYEFVERFMFGIDQIVDMSACGLAKERPLIYEGKYTLRSQCTRRVKECELVAVLTKHRDELQILADGLSRNEDKSLARMGELCTKILDNPDIARGRNCTWHLGDLVIALEMPSDAMMYTTNRRHFEPICGLLGKRLYTA